MSEQGGAAGGFDMSALLQQAQQMQQQLMEAKQAAEEQIVEGQAGGGVVKVQATGGLDFQSVTIDPAAVDPDDVEMLQDLVLAAIRDTVNKANELNREALGGLGDLAGGLGLG
jgi:nucleoid-associated protein EbfC